jgi:hypothetical protein
VEGDQVRFAVDLAPALVSMQFQGALSADWCTIEATWTSSLGEEGTLVLEQTVPNIPETGGMIGDGIWGMALLLLSIVVLVISNLLRSRSRALSQPPR